MPRRNRPKDSGNHSKRARMSGAAAGWSAGAPGRNDMASLVKSDGKCIIPGRKMKEAFNSITKAQQALEHAQANRALLNSTHVEKRYYLCPFEDRGGAAKRHYHLTSLDEFDPAKKAENGE